MATEFSRTLSLLRKERGISQRTAAGDLGASQALLSHYENGIREPGLAFVVRVCDYYHVSADYMLGRTLARDGSMLTAEEVLDMAEPGNILQGSVLATLRSKLLTGAVGVLFGLFGKAGRQGCHQRRSGQPELSDLSSVPPTPSGGGGQRGLFCTAGGGLRSGNRGLRRLAGAGGICPGYPGTGKREGGVPRLVP